MAKWKKWLITLMMSIQGMIGGIVVLLWIFRQEPWSLAINRWILTTIGQHTVVGLAIYLVLISLLIGGAVILSPNTNNGSFVNRYLAVGKDENYED